MASDYRGRLEPAAQPPRRRDPFAGLKLNAAPLRDLFAGLDLRPVSRPRSRDMFEGLDLRAASAPNVAPLGLEHAVQRFARATADIMRIRQDGYTELPHQKIAYDKTSAALDAVRLDAARDLRAAFRRDPGLVDAVAQGRTGAAVRAMAAETEMRASPARRADRFVEDWQKLAQAHRSANRAGDKTQARAIVQQMSGMGKSLERDAQAESLVRKRLPELGLSPHEQRSISHSIQDWLGHSRSRGLER